MRTSTVFALGLAAASLLCAGDDQKKKDDPSQIGNRDVGKGVNFYSIEKEIALGKQLAQEVELQARVVDDPAISELVNRIGQNLARNSDAKFPFTFKVIEGEEPNAFALPGGYVFVYTGLIKIADEEDEFAGAVSHEIAHVAARHMTRQATKSQIANIATIPLGVLLGGWAGIAARQGASLAVPAGFLKFARADESEADYLGTQYLYAAGYDPMATVSIFEKIESLYRAKPGVVARVFSTHPMDADRIQKTQKEIDRILPAKAEYVVSTSEYHDMRERLISKDQLRKRPEEKKTPTLRRSTPESQPDSDDRPTIRRRDLVE